MAPTFITLLMLIGSQLVLGKQTTADKTKFNIRMPDIRPDHAEQYLCMAHRLPRSQNGHFVVGINPVGDSSRVHHMLMYGCQVPGIYQRDSPNFVWDCGSMHTSSSPGQVETFEKGPVCQGKQQIMYGWALDAPALKMPEAVGFKVGGQDTDINFLILQVHYGHHHVFEHLPGLTDNSGLSLDLVPNEPNSGITKRAGILLLVSVGFVVPGKMRHEIWCNIEDDIEIHPFRYRVHTHKFGLKVMGAKIDYNVDNNDANNNGIAKSGRHEIIGEESPQKPQMFYPVKNEKLTIRKGDSVYAYCDFYNNQTQVVRIGETAADEMCNFYLMYWTDSDKLLSKNSCIERNPQSIFSNLLGY